MITPILFWARTGIELTAEPSNARRGTHRWPRKNLRCTTKTTTSLMWTSALWKLLWRPNNRHPFTVRRLLGRMNVAAGKNSPGDVHRMVEGAQAIALPNAERQKRVIRWLAKLVVTGVQLPSRPPCR